MWTAIKTFARTLPLKTWLILAGVLIVALLVLGYCSSRERVGQLEDQATIADGRTQTAAETIDAIAENAAANTSTQRQAQEAQREIALETDPVARDRLARCKLRQLQGDPAPC